MQTPTYLTQISLVYSKCTKKGGGEERKKKIPPKTKTEKSDLLHFLSPSAPMWTLVRIFELSFFYFENSPALRQ